jgi:hypothetical protein
MIDRRWIGRELPAATFDIERGRLAFFARAIGETDPVYLDPDAARAAGHPDIPAPPTFLFSGELDAGAVDPQGRAEQPLAHYRAARRPSPRPASRALRPQTQSQ